MNRINNQGLTGERALFKSEDLEVSDCYFYDGESPLKESLNIKVINSKFGWKYPLWYCNNVKVLTHILKKLLVQVFGIQIILQSMIQLLMLLSNLEELIYKSF